MKNSYFIQTKCSDIANKVLTAAIDTERTFKCNWPKHISSSVVNKPIPSFNASETFCTVVKSKNKFYDVQIQFLILFSLVNLNYGYLSCNTDCYYLKANIVKNLAACLIFMKYHIYNSSDCIGNIFFRVLFFIQTCTNVSCFCLVCKLVSKLSIAKSRFAFTFFTMEALSYELRDRTCMPPHMSKFTQVCFLLHTKNRYEPSRQAVFGMPGLYS